MLPPFGLKTSTSFAKLLPKARIKLGLLWVSPTFHGRVVPFHYFLSVEEMERIGLSLQHVGGDPRIRAIRQLGGGSNGHRRALSNSSSVPTICAGGALAKFVAHALVRAVSGLVSTRLVCM